MMRYTVEDIMQEGPCLSYHLSRVSALWGGAESLSPDDIARLPIPIDDRMWALMRLLFRLSPHRACRVARLVAIDVLDLWDPPDSVVWFLCGGSCGPSASRVATKAAGVARAARATFRSSAPVVDRVAFWAAKTSRISTRDSVRDTFQDTGPSSGSSRNPVRSEEDAIRATESSARVAETSAMASIWAYVGSAKCAALSFRTIVYASENASDGNASWKKYLSWVVKAFDPFTPVGDLS
jgi:hypothetical protein